MSPGEKITRRHLPHWFVPGAAHFVTFRLAGSLPNTVLEELRERKELLLSQKRPDGVSAFDHRARAHKQLFAAYDAYLDSHVDAKWLADERIAALVRSALYFHNHQRYHLHAYVIMPNHVHVLFEPILSPITQSTPNEKSLENEEPQPAIGEENDEESLLAGIMHSLKSFTAHRANRILQLTGSFWQHESYDHWVRDEDELERIVNYIGANPVNAGLAARPRDWIWSSAHDRLLRDGETTSWLGE